MEVERAKEVLLAYDAGNLLAADTYAVATRVFANDIAEALHFLEKGASKDCITSIETLARMLNCEPDFALETLKELRDEVVCGAYDKLGTGHVYALVNEFMPGLFKVGFTTGHPSERAKQISAGTGVPTPFHVLFSFRTMACQIVEAEIHKGLDAHRVNQSREFFKCPPATVLEAFEKAIKKIHTQEGFIVDQPVFHGVTEFYLEQSDAAEAIQMLLKQPSLIFRKKSAGLPEGSPF